LLRRRRPPVIFSVSKRTRRRDAFRERPHRSAAGKMRCLLPRSRRVPRRVRALQWVALATPGGGRYSRYRPRVDGISFTVHPLGCSEPYDPFSVVGINQGRRRRS
jgi:hypothetical protein